MPKVSRARYDQMEEARKVLAKLSPEDLKDKDKNWEILEKKGIKITPQALGKVRQKLLNPNGLESTDGGDLLKKIGIVSKTAKRVGGLDGLENVISIIRKVQGI